MTLSAHKVTSLTNGVKWNPSLCGSHVVPLVSDTKSLKVNPGEMGKRMKQMQLSGNRGTTPL